MPSGPPPPGPQGGWVPPPPRGPPPGGRGSLHIRPQWRGGPRPPPRGGPGFQARLPSHAGPEESLLCCCLHIVKVRPWGFCAHHMCGEICLAALKRCKYANRDSDPGGEARRREGATADHRALHRDEALQPLRVSPCRRTLIGHMSVIHRHSACLDYAAGAHQKADVHSLRPFASVRKLRCVHVSGPKAAFSHMAI